MNGIEPRDWIEALNALPGEGELLAFLKANQAKIQGAGVQEALYLTCEKGYRHAAGWLIEKKGMDVNARDARGETALHHALKKYGNMPVIGMLVEKGADVNARSQGGESPLVRAILISDDDVALFLLRHGGDVGAEWVEGKTLLHLTSSRNSLAMVEALLKRGAEIDPRDSNGATALHDAIASGAAQVVARLISAGADVHARVKVGYRTVVLPTNPANPVISHFEFAEGAGTLHLAAFEGDPAIARMLVEMGVTIDTKDAAGNQAAHYAAVNLRTDMLGFLLDAGADPDPRNSAGFTPLHYAFSFSDDSDESLQRQLATIKLLAAKGADVNAQTPAGKLPIESVASSRAKDYLKKNLASSGNRA